MKIKISLLLIILILYIILLHPHFLIEEIVLIYLLPVVGSLVVNGVTVLVKKSLGKQTSLLEDLKRELKWYAIIQFVMFAIIAFLIYPRHFEKNLFASDLDYLIEKLENIHPNLYHSISSDDFSRNVELTKDNLPEKANEVELYKELSRLLALLHDGHTRPGESFYQKRLKILFFKLFPYNIRITNDRIFVVGNYSFKNKIPPGAEILEINGIKPVEFIDQLKQLLSFDNRHNFQAQLQNPVLIGLWNDFKDFDIVYKNPQNETARKITSRGGLISNLSIMNRMLKGHKEPFYEFKVIDANIGYLGFYGFRNIDKFEAFLKKTFTEIKDQNIENLIIDIRNNGGGNSLMGNELMQYISAAPFTMLDSVEIKLSEEIISKNYVDWIDASQRIPGTVYKYVQRSDTELRDNPLRFHGNSYLLINEKVYSSAVIFASAFQCHKVGKIIGAETGGVTVAYGDVYEFNLPKTNYQINVSWKKFYHACGVDNRTGVIPDYFVSNSMEDKIAGIDRVIDFTLNLIKKSEKNNNQD